MKIKNVTKFLKICRDMKNLFEGQKSTLITLWSSVNMETKKANIQMHISFISCLYLQIKTRSKRNCKYFFFLDCLACIKLFWTELSLANNKQINQKNYTKMKLKHIMFLKFLIPNSTRHFKWIVLVLSLHTLYLFFF